MMNRTTKLLFICLGNICRSPAANAIMQKYVDEAGLSDKFEIDSAGIGPWHVGQLPDKRMREHGARRGYRIDHIARQFDATKDFDRFDYIVVMDEDNYRNITRQARNDDDRKKVIRMADYFIKWKGRTSVPDPYYGDGEDFELALDLIEDGCKGLLARLNNH
jgi:protein-tyrosine phosphatase